MESMLEILNGCLQDSNLETVSKADLRKKYLEKTGLTKLPHKDKELFASAVNAAFINYIANKTATPNETNIDGASEDELKENCQDWKLTMSSSSEDEITSANIKESVIDAQFMNGKNDIMETFGDEIKETGQREKLIMNPSIGDNTSPGNKENIINDEFENGVNSIEMESSGDDDEKSIASLKSDIIKKSPLDSTPDGFKRQRGKRTLISSSEDETIQLESTERNKVLKKARRSGDLEAGPISESEKKVPKNVKNQNRLKKAIVESSDSEDEPLIGIQKKSNSLSESENESLAKFTEKQFNCHVDSEDEPIMPFTKKNKKIITNSMNDSSDSEDEPLMVFKNIHSNGGKKSETKPKSNRSQSQKSKNDFSDSEDEPLAKFRKSNDSNRSDKNSKNFAKKKPNSSNKLSKSIESTSGSEDESLAKYTKKKANNSIVSSDSEDEPLTKLSIKKVSNFKDSKKKQMNKVIKEKVENSAKKLLANSKSKKESLKKKRFVDDDSEEELIATLVKKSDPLHNSSKPVKNSSDSEDEPLNILSNKKKDYSNDPANESVEKNVKEKVKHSLKKPITNNKSKDQTLKKKKLVDSDDDAILSSGKKEILLDEKMDTLLSDSSDDEPFSNIRKELNNPNDSKEDASISNQKKEKSFSEKTNSLLSDSSEDEPLSNIKKKANSSSDSEDEPLNKLSTKNSDKKRKNSESGSCSFVDENDEQSSKKKPSKKKEAHDSGKQGKKRPTASENKIEHLKKYLRVAGIRVTNYNKLFESCKTMKAKCEKMMSLLEKEGLKGRPTLEKCKKLRVKIETKREIAELDVSNILKEGGRPKRSVCIDTTNCKQEEKSTPIHKFSRLQGIVDSEESD